MRRRKRRKQRKIIIISSLTLLFIMTVGYAAFQTNINITAKGNIKKMTAAQYLRTKVTTSGDGLYNDTYEEGRYIYKGGNPNNFITFNNELWRIMSIESDGTLKIIKKDNIGRRPFDSVGARTTGYCSQGTASTNGCNAWMASSNLINGTYSGVVNKDSELNTYLNGVYYNSLSSNAKSLIQKYNWVVGSLNEERNITWYGLVGLMSVQDVVKANTNIEQCGNTTLLNQNRGICAPTNYIVPKTGYLWTITISKSTTHSVQGVGGGDTTDNARILGLAAKTDTSPIINVLPAVYLKTNIYLTGEGTETKPYIITT